MNLSLLLERIPFQTTSTLPTTPIRQITTDSREVKPGDVFIAITGLQSDGHRYIPQAIQNGAVAVITEKVPAEDDIVPIIQVNSTREAFSMMQQAWFGYPSEKLRVTAVTGSNGKTTVAYLLYKLLNETGYQTGLIGTAGYYSGRYRLETTLKGPVTTPDPDQLQSLLALFVEQNCQYAVMEASSFGIEQKRVFGIAFDGLIWTNFSANHHLQYHVTEEAYFQAKTSLLAQGKPGGIIVLNRDMTGYEQCKQMAPQAVSVGYHPEADLVLQSVVTDADAGLRIRFLYQKHQYFIESPLCGAFQAYNIAQVFLSALHVGLSPDKVIETIRSIRQIPGRWEIIHVQEVPCSVLIDKANTQVSIQALLENLASSHFAHKIAVYGQVGGGDPSQRKETGSLLSSYFDTIFLTTDDPENEDPMIGIRQFLEGVPASKLPFITIELSRERAIRAAMQSAKPNDVIAVLGRGNQREFLIQGRTEIFDDTVECRKIIQSFGWKA